jgi:transaldolase
LILAATKQPGYARLIDVAIKYGKEKKGDIDAQANAAMDRLVRIKTFSYVELSWLIL